MKKNTNNSPFHSYQVIICAILMSFGLVYVSTLGLPTSAKEQAVKGQHILNKTVKFKPLSARNIPVKTTPEPKPDYQIPPVEAGMAPLVYKLPTSQNIVFLGIDDGVYKDQSIVDLMYQHNIKASLFLSKGSMGKNPEFFKQLIEQGSYIENHTISHDVNMTRTKNYEQQKFEICSMADYELVNYGRRPKLFRPPGGDYSDTMLRAAADCGMRAVVTWVAEAKGGVMYYQDDNKLHPGDIVLMHFRPEFKADLEAFIGAMNASGLHTALMEDALW